MDPWCGGGVRLIEARQLRDDARYVGGEPDGERLARAMVNAEAGEAQITWFHWDGTRLPLREGTADGVISSFLSPATKPVEGSLGEVERLLRRDGTAVLLMERDRDLEARIRDESGLREVNRRPIHLRGRHPSVYVLKKR